MRSGYSAVSVYGLPLPVAQGGEFGFVLLSQSAQSQVIPAESRRHTYRRDRIIHGADTYPDFIE